MNTANIGVAVNVLRGSLEIVGVEDSLGGVSLDQGVVGRVPERLVPRRHDGA